MTDGSERGRADFRENLSVYRNCAFSEVYGWVGAQAVDALELASAFHAEHGISGDALEIGVFHGRFFLALMAALGPADVAVAVDIFDNQDLNVDNSGVSESILSSFKLNVAKYAANPDALRVIPADSMTLKQEQVLRHSNAGAFRLVSVDGGHTPEHVINDLTLASQVIVGGGAIFLDDFVSPHWPGVQEGYIRYMMFSNRNLAPVLYTDNKLVMTSIPHQAQMVQYMRDHFVPTHGRYMADVKSLGFSYIASS